MATNLDLLISTDGMPSLIMAGASVIDPDTKSGNPAHEIWSGRFGTGPGQKNRRKVDRDRRQGQPSRRSGDVEKRPDVERRRDAVADAARQVEDIGNEQELRRFMKSRWSGSRAMTDDDIASFLADVRRQRIEDVIDSLDSKLRNKMISRGKSVKVDFPRAWLRRTIRGLDNDELASVLTRLRVRGWSEAELKTHVVQRLDTTDRRLERAQRAIQ